MDRNLILIFTQGDWIVIDSAEGTVVELEY